MFGDESKFILLSFDCAIYASRIQGWILDLVIGSLVIESAFVVLSITMGWIYSKYNAKKRNEKAKEITRTLVGEADDIAHTFMGSDFT